MARFHSVTISLAHCSIWAAVIFCGLWIGFTVRSGAAKRAAGICGGRKPPWNALRGTGQGFCCNAGRGVGAVFPTLVGMLSAKAGLPTAIAVTAVVAYTVMLVCAFLLPETTLVSLTSLTPRNPDRARQVHEKSCRPCTFAPYP
ncbi:MAG TPA: hypothetical protein VMU59_00440 [Caulobacteraceae bacterium]|nr:hypothetical protein [Caulobacteraceae bacterium]